MSTTKFEIIWHIDYVPDRYREESGSMIVDVPDWLLDSEECDHYNGDDSKCELTKYLTRYLQGSIGGHAHIEEIHCAK